MEEKQIMIFVLFIPVMMVGQNMTIKTLYRQVLLLRRQYKTTGKKTTNHKLMEEGSKKKDKCSGVTYTGTEIYSKVSRKIKDIKQSGKKK